MQRPALRLQLGKDYLRAAGALALLMFGYVLIFIYFAAGHSEQLYEVRRDEIRRLVEIAQNALEPLLENMYEQRLPVEGARKAGIGVLRRMTYGTAEVETPFFAGSYDGIALLSLAMPTAKNLDLLALSDPETARITHEMVERARSPEHAGYVDHYETPTDGGPPRRKLSYVVGIEDWGIYIGTGIFVDDIDAENAAYIQRGLLLTGGLFLLLLALLALTLRPAVLTYHALASLFEQVVNHPDSVPTPPRLHPNSQPGKLTLAFTRLIRQLQKNKQLVQESESKYRSIFETTQDGLIIHRLDDGSVVDANPAACQMHGYTYGEFVGLLPESLFDADALPLFGQFLGQARANHTFRTQTRSRRKGGAYIDIDMRGTPILYRGKPHALSVIHDVSEQVWAYRTLERRVTERTRELTTLLAISHDVASTLDLEPLLDLILAQLGSVVDYTGAAIYILDDLEDEALMLLRYRGPEAPTAPAQPLQDEMFAKRAPVIIPDLQAETLHTSAPGYARSWMGVPLLVKDETRGMLSLHHSIPGFYEPKHASFAAAFATHAVIAIENARLYEQARELAAVQERHRLARDLHDAVTQTLFSAALIADVLPRIWERNPAEGHERLQELRQLSRGALAEMRALLLELRPTALIEVGLGELLRHLCDATAGRARISIELQVEGGLPSRRLPPDVQVTFYRIAQEALNNVTKHARAAQARVRLQFVADESVELTICDDGQGFEPPRVAKGRLGLEIMRERAAVVGAKLAVDSVPGIGTTITAIWHERISTVAS